MNLFHPLQVIHIRNDPTAISPSRFRATTRPHPPRSTYREIKSYPAGAPQRGVRSFADAAPQHSHGRRHLHRLRPRRRRPRPPASLLYQLHERWPGVGEEPADDEEPGEERQDHLHDVPTGLAAEGPERDRVRAHRVAGAVEHPADQRQQPHGALLRQHRRGARPLPLAAGAPVAVLAVAGDVAPGSLHRAHLRPDRLQGQDRGLLPEVVDFN